MGINIYVYIFLYISSYNVENIYYKGGAQTVLSEFKGRGHCSWREPGRLPGRVAKTIMLTNCYICFAYFSTLLSGSHDKFWPMGYVWKCWAYLVSQLLLQWMRQPPIPDVAATNGRKAISLVPECWCGVETPPLTQTHTYNPTMDMYHEQNINPSYAKPLGLKASFVTVG